MSWNDYIIDIDMGLSALHVLLSRNKNQMPAELVEAIQATIDALNAHRDDPLTKANFEAQRG